MLIIALTPTNLLEKVKNVFKRFKRNEINDLTQNIVMIKQKVMCKS